MLLLFLVLLVLSFVLVLYRALVVFNFYVAQLLKVLHPLVKHTLSLTQFLHMDVQLVLIVLHFLNVSFQLLWVLNYPFSCPRFGLTRKTRLPSSLCAC